MKFFNLWKKYTKPVLVLALLVAILGTAVGCEDYGFPSAAPLQQEKPETAEASIVINTKDGAMLAVYQHLLEQAETYEAKLYLADFYTTSDNWSAVGEYFLDGSGVWYILVDMSGVKVWSASPHWQQASWYVFKHGEVIPSNLLNANAMRIEADLQELSPKAESK